MRNSSVMWCTRQALPEKVNVIKNDGKTVTVVDEHGYKYTDPAKFYFGSLEAAKLSNVIAVEREIISHRVAMRKLTALSLEILSLDE